jgi:hypothetical protein
LPFITAVNIKKVQKLRAKQCQDDLKLQASIFSNDIGSSDSLIGHLLNVKTATDKALFKLRKRFNDSGRRGPAKTSIDDQSLLSISQSHEYWSRRSAYGETSKITSMRRTYFTTRVQRRKV